MSADQKIPFSRFTTTNMRPCDQFEAWHESISVIFQTQPLPGQPPAAGFAATLSGYHLGNLLLSQVDFDGQRFERDRRKLTLDGMDHYLVQLYASGGLLGVADDRERVLRGGDVQILDLARTNDTVAKASNTIGVVVPREALREAMPGTDNLHGLVLRGDVGIGGLLADYLRSLIARADTITLADAPNIAQATTDLIAACFRTTAASVARARPVLEATLLERLRAHIDTQLSSPGLGPEALCAAFRLSRTHLYRLFEPLGGVAAYIQGRRLTRARGDLADPAKARLKIYEIAYAWGFVSEAHFSRAFRRAFGLTPGQVRALDGMDRARMAAATADSIGSRAYEGWLRGLRHA
jgi:AraC-like DNA-binding protein